MKITGHQGFPIIHQGRKDAHGFKSNFLKIFQLNFSSFNLVSLELFGVIIIDKLDNLFLEKTKAKFCKIVDARYCPNLDKGCMSRFPYFQKKAITRSSFLLARYCTLNNKLCLSMNSIT